MRKLLLVASLCLPLFVSAQETVSLNDMSFWKPTGKTNWQIAGEVNADLSKSEAMTITAGKGVLVNLPDANNRANLISAAEYGDVDVEFDFMMATHSNSGFYLQGRYEIQLLDSWGVKKPAYGDCGGIYKRRKFIPQEYLYEGHAPRVNACLAPGLWQHMQISFQAPRFDAAGKKIANAKVLLIKLNGAVLHENVELTGPTGGPISETEAALGPFMIQGDHGAVAFRNIKVANFSGKPATMSPVSYKVFYGKFKEPKDFLSKKPDATGSIDKLSWDVSKQTNDFAQIFTTTLDIPKAGNHTFEFQLAGKYYVNVNGKELLPDAWTQSRDKRSAEIELPAGKVPVEITVYKTDGWMPPILGMWVKGPSFRSTAYHTLASTLSGPPADPILLDAKEPLVFRSFTDLYDNGKKIKRVVHAVNVGNPSNLHYTYDLDNGAIVQIWKGDFLDTSPMWDDRGDGSSRARGALLTLTDSPVVVANADKATLLDVPANYRPLGYVLDANDLPTFRYQIANSEIEDQIRVTDDKYLLRTLTFKTPAANQSVRLAVGKDISKLSDDTYLVDGKSYYIKATGASIEKAGDKTILTVPVAEKVQYSIMW
ncbi:family 16 glycoside hydrolase [Flectobacillus major]|uniref:family 16 glycoside hydrolase n=1 Tax=Flectobacillus major TaxID=103 RepID=UPI0003F8B3DF|nr:family 16 glycoside hydrolase [Flectobacillus major]